MVAATFALATWLVYGMALAQQTSGEGMQPGGGAGGMSQGTSGGGMGGECCGGAMHGVMGWGKMVVMALLAVAAVAALVALAVFLVRRSRSGPRPPVAST